MTKKTPNVTAHQLARLKSEDEQLRPELMSEVSDVRAAWQEYSRAVTAVIARHADEIDHYIRTHGPMTRAEVVELALEKLLSN